MSDSKNAFQIQAAEPVIPPGEGTANLQRGDLIEELRQRANELRNATKEGRFGFNEPGPKDPGTTPPLLGRAEALAARLISLKGDPETKRRMADDGPDGRSFQLEYFRACCWTAEVLEYFGGTNRVREIVEDEGRLISGALLNIPCGTLVERKRARQMLWMVLHYLYCCLYRRHDYHKALRVIDTCSQFMESQLIAPAFPCFYTRARIAAYRGAICRQLGKLEQAQQAYEEALELIHRRLAHEKELVQASPDEPAAVAKRISQEETRAGYEAAKILALGVGWVQFQKGLLREAFVDITTALVMLSPIRDVLRTAFAELLIGSIERASAGFDASKLDRAIAIMQPPYRTFGEYNHVRYRSYADYELALAYLYRAKAEQYREPSGSPEPYYSAAAEHIRRVSEFSQGAGDIRWECISLIVLSRIARYRNQIGEAKVIAERALALTVQAEQDVQIVLDAHIALGEAILATGAPTAEEFTAASGHFECALALAGTNPKAAASCHLHLANAFLRQGNLGRALEHFDRWGPLKDKVQHGIVHEFAKETERQIELAKRERYIVSGDGTLNYAHHERRLREFLVCQAALHHKGVQAIADCLGIKRATYYNWLKEMRTRPTVQAVNRSR